MTRKSVPFTTPYSVKHDTKYVWVGSFASVRPDHGNFRSTPVKRTLTERRIVPPGSNPFVAARVKRTCSALVVTSDSDPPLKLATSTHPQSAAGSRSCRAQTQR